MKMTARLFIAIVFYCFQSNVICVKRFLIFVQKYILYFLIFLSISANTFFYERLRGIFVSLSRTALSFSVFQTIQRCDAFHLKLISLHIRSMWETTVMHKQVSGCTVNFGPNFPESPFLESQTRKAPPPFWKTSDLGWPKFTPEYPPLFRKLQSWDDQSLLRNTPPFWKTSDLGWPKFTPEYPSLSENFRFGMTKVYSGIPPPHFGKLQIWDDQSLLRNTPPPRVLECRELLHVETLSNPDNYSLLICHEGNDKYSVFSGDK